MSPHDCVVFVAPGRCGSRSTSRSYGSGRRSGGRRTQTLSTRWSTSGRSMSRAQDRRSFAGVPNTTGARDTRHASGSEPGAQAQSPSQLRQIPPRLNQRQQLARTSHHRQPQQRKREQPKWHQLSQQSFQQPYPARPRGHSQAHTSSQNFLELLIVTKPISIYEPQHFPMCALILEFILENFL